MNSFLTQAEREYFGLTAAVIDHDAISKHAPRLKDLCQEYHADDTSNADEMRINYSLAPDRTISAVFLSVHKKNKKRLTLLACSNAIGTEKPPLMVIGNSMRPTVLRRELFMS